MTTPRDQHLSVDGEIFTASPDPSQPGTWHVRWESGPHPGYGFSVAAYDSRWHPEGLEDAVRSFLAQIDPRTGYLAD